MSHSFTEHVVSAGVFIHTSCVSCGCISCSPEACQPCEKKELEKLLYDITSKGSNCGNCPTNFFVNGYPINVGGIATAIAETIGTSNVLGRILKSPESSLSPEDIKKYGILFRATAPPDQSSNTLDENEHQKPKDDLKTLGETAYQSEFDTKNNDNSYIAFTSRKNCKTASFLSHEHWFSASARYDNGSLVRPLGIEFKGQPHHASYKAKKELSHHFWGALRQATERVNTMGAHFHQYACFGSFAVTYNHCCLVWLEHKWKKYNCWTMSSDLHFFMLSKFEQSFPTIWATLTKEAVEYPSALHTFFAPYVYQYLKPLTPYPGYCRVVAVGASASVVVGITFPQCRTDDDSTNSIVTSKTRKHVMLKVCLDNDDFLTEQRSLCTMAEYLRTSGSTEAVEAFYAIGHQKCDAPSATYPAECWQNYFRDTANYLHTVLAIQQTFQYPTDPWWTATKIASPTRGGMIVMRAGQYKISRREMAQHSLDVMKGVMWWIPFIHKAGLLHRDIRYRNVMFFPPVDLRPLGNYVGSGAEPEVTDYSSGWQLVDYGMACYVDQSGGADSAVAAGGAAGVVAAGGADSVVAAGGADSVVAAGVSSLSLSDQSSPACESTTLTIHKDFGQYAGAGFAVRAAGKRAGSDEFEYRWSVHDDYDMAFAMYRALETLKNCSEDDD